MNIEGDIVPGLKWGSHQCAIAACFAASTGHVLEVGVGHFSTPLLHALCLSAGRDLFSVEADEDWCQRFAKIYWTPKHQFWFGPYDELIPKIAKSYGSIFGLSFIDNSPGGSRRAADFLTVLPVSQYIVIHDYEAENLEAIGPLLGGLKHHVMRQYEPPTLIVANQGFKMPLGIY